MRVVLFTTASPCPLCVDAYLLLDDLSGRWGFALESVDVDGDPDLVRRHRTRVPVLEVDGREVGYGRLRRLDVESALRAGGAGPHGMVDGSA